MVIKMLCNKRISLLQQLARWKSSSEYSLGGGILKDQEYFTSVESIDYSHSISFITRILWFALQPLPQLTIAVVAESTVGRPGGSPDVARGTPFQLDLLTLHPHGHVSSGSPQIAFGRVIGICEGKKMGWVSRFG